MKTRYLRFILLLNEFLFSLLFFKIFKPLNLLNHLQLAQLQQTQQGLLTNSNLNFENDIFSSSSPTHSSIQNNNKISSNIQKTFYRSCNTPKTPNLLKYSTDSLLQNSQKNIIKEGKQSPKHGSEAPLPILNNNNNQKINQAKQQQQMTNLQHFDENNEKIIGFNERNLSMLGFNNDPQLLARLENVRFF
jgi:hypothetical protein